MPKRYKKGNKKKKSKVKSIKDDFYYREKILQRKINKFVRDYYNLQYPPLKSEYDFMNRQRLDIKSLLDAQGQYVYTQSKRRKFFYNKQLNRFKYYYVAWKRFTYYVYLEQKFDMPIRFHAPLSFFKKNCQDVNTIRYQF